MARKKQVIPMKTNNEIRHLLLQYFYDRNKNATSSMGKKGSAIKISDVKRELKEQYELKQTEVQSNLTYLISQGWVEDKEVQKQFQAKGGTMIPSTTTFYQITAVGIDKIEGPGEFTMPRYHGIKIEASGQNIITLGDGNQINAQYSDLGQALVELQEAITNSEASESEKIDLVADIHTIQSQLGKEMPNKGIVKTAWDVAKGAAIINGCTSIVEKVSDLIQPFIS